MNVDQTGIRLYYALVRIVRNRQHRIGYTGRCGRNLDFTAFLFLPLAIFTLGYRAIPFCCPYFILKTGTAGWLTILSCSSEFTFCYR